MINTNAREIKKIEVDTTNLPKNKAGKNDRVAMVEGLEHGHKYTVSVKFIYADWSEYVTEFTITRLLQNREWINILDTGEGRFNSFSVLFNSFLIGNFKTMAQIASDNYFRMIQEVNAPLQETITRQQQDLTNTKYELEKTQNALVVANETIYTLQNEMSNSKKHHRYVKDYRYVKDEGEYNLNESMDKFARLAEMMANAKVDHDTFKKVLLKNFEDMFLR